MKFESKRVREWNVIKVSDDNFSFETGLLGKEEYSELAKSIFGELLYCSDDSFFKWLGEEYKGDFKEAGFNMNKEPNE